MFQWNPPLWNLGSGSGQTFLHLKLGAQGPSVRVLFCKHEPHHRVPCSLCWDLMYPNYQENQFLLFRRPLPPPAHPQIPGWFLLFSSCSPSWAWLVNCPFHFLMVSFNTQNLNLVASDLSAFSFVTHASVSCLEGLFHNTALVAVSVSKFWLLLSPSGISSILGLFL